MRWAAVMMLAVLCVLPVLGMGASQYMDGRENVAYRCVVMPDPPAGVLPVEDPLYEASVTWMPAGRLCTFHADDDGFVSVQTGWPATVAGLVATALAAVLTIVALRLRGDRGHLTTSIPLAVIVLVWVLVILSAHTTTA